MTGINVPSARAGGQPSRLPARPRRVDVPIKGLHPHRRIPGIWFSCQHSRGHLDIVPDGVGAAVQQLMVTASGPGKQLASFQQRHTVAAQGQIMTQRPADATADDQDVFDTPIRMTP